MKIKIISDGTSKGTQVVNAETGERIKGVKSVSWSCRVGCVAEAAIEFIGVPVELNTSPNEDCDQ